MTNKAIEVLDECLCSRRIVSGQALVTALASEGFQIVPVEQINWQNDTALTDNFMEAVEAEIVHQRKRWGFHKDACKSFDEWCTLAIYLLGKAISAFWAGDEAKQKHHVITVAAAMGNCHAMLTASKMEDT